MEDTLGTQFSKDFNQCDSSSTIESAILNVLFTNFRPRDQEAKEVSSTLCRFGRWHDQLTTNKYFFFQSRVLASESSLHLTGFFVDISLRLKLLPGCVASCTLQSWSIHFQKKKPVRIRNKPSAYITFNNRFIGISLAPWPIHKYKQRRRSCSRCGGFVSGLRRD